MRDSAFAQVVALATHGIPMNVAMKWSAARRFAALAVIGEMHGGKFDEETLTIRYPNGG